MQLVTKAGNINYFLLFLLFFNGHVHFEELFPKNLTNMSVIPRLIVTLEEFRTVSSCVKVAQMHNIHRSDFYQCSNYNWQVLN